MEKRKKEILMALIYLSKTFEDADNAIETYAGFKNYEDKIKFLTENFDCEEIDKKESYSPELIYNITLNSILKSKY